MLVSLVVFGLAAFVYSEAQTKEYAATATLYVTSGTDDNSSSAYQGSLASQQRVASYVRLVRSDAVVDGALRSAGLDMSLASAKAALNSEATGDTVLMTITATDSDPGVAENLTNAVANSMTTYVARLETPSGGGQPLAKLTVVTPAVRDNDPVEPRVGRNVSLGVIAGLIVGCFVVVLRVKLSSRLRTQDDVETLVEPPVLATVPTDGLLKQRGLIDFSDGASPAAEAFRKLRTNLTFSNVDNPPRAILITSATAVEGKTTTAMNLAAALVEGGSRVALIDADLRRPQVDARSGLVGGVGLTNLLRGDGEINDLIQPSHIDGLWVMASGPKPPNPAELLSSKRAEQLVSELKRSFDFVVIDSPPLLPVTDSLVLSRWVDGVVMVVRSGNTRRADFLDAFAQAAATRTPVLGFVLTGTPVDKARYGYYAVKPRRPFWPFGRVREPKAIQQVLEPARNSKH